MKLNLHFSCSGGFLYTHTKAGENEILFLGFDKIYIISRPLWQAENINTANGKLEILLLSFICTIVLFSKRAVHLSPETKVPKTSHIYPTHVWIMNRHTKDTQYYRISDIPVKPL